MEKENLVLDRNRRRVNICPCGKSNKDGKFVPFKNYDKYGYCHSCGETFFPDNKKEYKPIFKPPKPVSKHDYKLVTDAGRNFKNNNFIKWLKTRFTDEQIRETITAYLIGSSNHWNGATVFWQIDKFQRVRSGKIMLYNSSNGKRVKEPYNHINWVHSVLKTPHFNLIQCLFGEHLLNEHQDKIVAIVEAEKTAIYMSNVYPEKLWLATGNKGNFKYQLLKSLYGRTIEAYPDKSEFNTWNDVASELNEKGFNITVDVTMEESEMPKGSDLVDYLESNFTMNKPKQLQDKIITKIEKEVSKMSKNNDNIYKLIEAFELTDEYGFKIRKL